MHVVITIANGVPSVSKFSSICLAEIELRRVAIALNIFDRKYLHIDPHVETLNFSKFTGKYNSVAIYYNSQ